MATLDLLALRALVEAVGGGAMKTPVILDAVADKVLSYRPKAESKAAKKRQRKRRQAQRAR